MGAAATWCNLWDQYDQFQACRERGKVLTMNMGRDGQGKYAALCKWGLIAWGIWHTCLTCGYIATGTRLLEIIVDATQLDLLQAPPCYHYFRQLPFRLAHP